MTRGANRSGGRVIESDRPDDSKSRGEALARLRLNIFNSLAVSWGTFVRTLTVLCDVFIQDRTKILLISETRILKSQSRRQPHTLRDGYE